MSNYRDAKPFLKWAGSKSKLLRHILPYIPEKYSTYYEPFLGSGALFFSLNVKLAVLGDVITDLIETYASVRDDPQRIISLLSKWSPNKETYYAIRSRRPHDRFERASQFIFLNKTCWNGLYRVNLNGEFNVPFGRMKSNFIYCPDNLQVCANKLSVLSVSLVASDFSKTIETAAEGDLVYFDPPYVTSHYTNGFHEWNAKLFTWNDQVRLANAARELVRKGVTVLMTNADHPDILMLYKGFTVRRFERYSTLASNADHRRRTTEVLITGKN